MEIASDQTELNYLVQAYDAGTGFAQGGEMNLPASGAVGRSRTLWISWDEPAKLTFAVTLRFGASKHNARSPASERSSPAVTVGASRWGGAGPRGCLHTF